MRGIYATAIASLLAMNGYILADLSEVLQSRINRPSTNLPPHVTVKTEPDKRDELLIIGYPWQYGKNVEETILETLHYSVVRRGRYGINTVVWGESLGDCRILLPGGEIARLKHKNSEDEGCPGKGEKLLVSVVREKLSPRDQVIVSKDVRVVGMYSILISPGRGVSFSEHIRSDDKRLELAEIAARSLDLNRFHVRFRSSSKFSSPDEIEKELGKLKQEMESLLTLGESAPTRVLRRGEYISIITVSQPDKLELDELRSKTTPTVKFHHTLKSGGKLKSELVDYAEHLIVDLNIDPVKLGYSTLNYIAGALRGRIIPVKHMKPDGDYYNLTPGKIESVELKPNKPPVLTVKRIFKTKGMLDGLNVEKMPGDYDVMRVDLGSWRIVHEYYTRQGDPLGIYVNINTPPEIDEDSIKYIDLYIDVVMKPGGTPEIIDRDQLDKAYDELVVSEELYRKAIEEAEKAYKTLQQLPL